MCPNDAALVICDDICYTCTSSRNGPRCLSLSIEHLSEVSLNLYLDIIWSGLSSSSFLCMFQLCNCGPEGGTVTRGHDCFDTESLTLILDVDRDNSLRLS